MKILYYDYEVIMKNENGKWKMENENYHNKIDFNLV